jgi:hypothetical protein
MRYSIRKGEKKEMKNFSGTTVYDVTSKLVAKLGTIT